MEKALERRLVRVSLALKVIVHSITPESGVDADTMVELESAVELLENAVLIDSEFSNPLIAEARRVRAFG